MDARLKEIAENFDSMKRDVNDTFKFHCTQCGKCCINREDILMSPQDIFKAAKELQISTVEFVNQYCESYVGNSSRMPIVRLLPRGTIKRCPLLRDKKCMIHNAKPVVCAMFPLGRAVKFDAENYDDVEVTPDKVQYIINPIVCGDNSETYTVKEWLESFGIPLKDEYFARWQTTIAFLSPRIQKFEKMLGKDLMNRFFNIITIKLYLDYDMNTEFYPQFVRNTDECISLMKKLIALKEESSNE